MKPKIFILYAILCLVWGTTWAVLKISLAEGTPPIYGAGIRFLIAGIIVFVLLWIKKEPIPKEKAQWKLILQFSILNFTFSYALNYWGAQFVYSSVASLIWAAFPLVMAFFANFMLPNEKLTSFKWIGILIGTMGAVLIVGRLDELGSGNLPIGAAALFLAVLSATLPNIRLKQNVGLVSVLQLNSVGLTIAGIILLSISKFMEPEEIMVWSTINIAALVYLIIFGTVFTWLVYIWLFEHLSMNQIAYIAFFPPMIATVLGWVFLGEHLTFFALIGGAFIVIGAVMVNLNGKKSVQ
ncbi:MAG: EamA family transporter [Candidatus Marinimicrobia bacterium]|jgi:drug/metabolite transporter (DMT)-like permease|nr:EamA family transporter [Candidatus Neomarinimicrobiota bacterium]MBT3617922.1 EamA family transporter [Candidatus Neomarinimicrobiota bacterium]MBT3828759.1 EamA family transporter [Candidatus Neomarinimicrobiota bacterium]MBT3997050.1 EamA family transporter [Candidatus Neomarinimicrobiota bacterium]MBT4280806.1 EamA family transporter [Candidatus Neomarinimicrobiota bacterium]